MQEVNGFWKILEDTIKSNAIGNGGQIIPIIDLWRFLSPELAKLSKTSSEDITLFYLQKLMNSALPQCSILISKMLNNNLNEIQVRQSRMSDVKNFVEPSVTKEEWDFSEKIISNGGINGYSLEYSSLYSEPFIMKKPEKKIAAIPHPEWIKSSGQELPFFINIARFVIADGSFLYSNQFKNLINLQKKIKVPIIFMCWNIDEKIAKWFGDAWKTNEFWIIPCEAESLQEDSLFKNNILADTAWITGSSMSSYVYKDKVEDITESSPILSGDFTHLKFGYYGCRFPAYSTSKFCNSRAKQLLSMSNGDDDSALLYKKRAQYIQGVDFQAYIPTDSKIRISSIDLVVSAYKEFMHNGACEIPESWNLPWKSVPSNYMYECSEACKTIQKFSNVIDYEIS